MALSQIWTLAAAAAPGDERPLSEWGFEGAHPSFRSLGADTLRLSLAVQDALDHEPLWPWEEPLILYRDGVPFFRGRVDSRPRSGSGGAESASYEVRGVWWDLERHTYLQTWTTVAGGTTTGRAYLGGSSGDIAGSTTRGMLEALATAATAAGTELVIDASALPSLSPPPITGTNRTYAQIILEIMRWHPDAVLVQDHAASTPTLRALPRAAMATTLWTVGERPLEGLDLRDRPDLVPDAVHVLYETAAPQVETLPGWDPATHPAAVRVARRLVVGRDIWPPDAPVTRRSLVVTLPGPDLPEIEAEAEATAVGALSPPVPHRHPIQTRPLPPTGATNAAAQKWWLDRSGLGSLGIAMEDIWLATTSTETVWAHTVEFADDGESDDEPPSAINPNSTPIYRPASPSDLPREHLSGGLAEWMGVKWADVVVRATVAVRASTVDALPAASRALVERMAPRRSTAAGHQAYLIDREVRTTATNARTQVYLQWPAAVPSGGDPADPEAGNPAAAAAAADRAIRPGLARAMWESRAEMPYEGALALVAQEAGEVRHLGQVVGIAGGRPEWLAMRAMVQAETQDLATGTTRLEVGPPNHLSAQDWADLHHSAQLAQTGRALLAAAPRDPATGDYDPPPPIPPPIPPDDDPDLPGGGGVFGAVSFPHPSSSTIGGGGLGDAERQWQLRVFDDGSGGGPVAEILAGTLTGLGLSGYGWAGGDWEEGVWMPVEHGEQVWLVLTVEVSGAPLTYFSGPGVSETIWLPSHVSDAEASVHVGPPPATVRPTVDFGSGEPGTSGVYVFLIGSTAGGVATNHYMGPLGIGWCAPDTAALVELTDP